MTAMVDIARTYVTLGINPLPIQLNGSKAPSIKQWAHLQTKQITEEEIQRFWAYENGIAAIGGTVSGGLEDIDFDDPDVFEEWSQIVKDDLGEEFFQKLLIVRTPRPGYQVPIRSTAVGRSAKLARRNDPHHKPSDPASKRVVGIIETKGEGGYFLLPGCPPECHPTRRTYQVIQGSFENIPVLTPHERQVLISCARSFDEVVRPEYAPRPAERQLGELLPGDDFNKRSDWHTLLTRNGFRFFGVRNEVTRWTRPGKNSGVSATTNFAGLDRFYPFSSSIPGFDDERSYSKFQVLAILEYSGDFSATARALSREGYGSRGEIRPNDRNEDLEERLSIQDEPRLGSTGPDRARTYQSATEPETFISKYVDYARRRTDAPEEAHELIAVGTLSALAGPNPRLPIATSISGWSLVIWVLYCVDSTSGRKSTVINIAVDILVEVLGHDAVLFWEGSPQGIIQRLQIRDGLPAIFARDEYSGLLGQMNRAGGHMTGLAQMFIRAYDGGTLENIRTKKKNRLTGDYDEDTDTVKRPYLVKLCASTWDSFVKRASIDNVLDGFLARFAVFSGASEPQEMKKASPELQTLRLSLLDHARTFHEKARLVETLDIQDEVLKMAWKLEQDWAKVAAEAPCPDAAGPALKRLAETVFKVAGLLAIDSAVLGEVPAVLPKHFKAARTLGERWIKSTLKLIDALGRNDFQQNCEAVLATIRKNPEGVRVRDVYRNHRKLELRDFNAVLTALQTQDEITVSDGEVNSGPAFRFVQATRRSE